MKTSALTALLAISLSAHAHAACRSNTDTARTCDPRQWLNPTMASQGWWGQNTAASRQSMLWACTHQQPGRPMPAAWCHAAAVGEVGGAAR